jgi:hypothetical protein
MPLGRLTDQCGGGLAQRRLRGEPHQTIDDDVGAGDDGLHRYVVMNQDAATSLPQRP